MNRISLGTLSIFGMNLLSAMAIARSPVTAKLRIEVNTCSQLMERVVGIAHTTERITVGFDAKPADYFKGYLSVAKTSLTDRVKNLVLRNQPTAQYVEQLVTPRQLAEIPAHSTLALNDVLQTGQKYNYVVTDLGMYLSSTSSDPVQDLLSKHFYLSQSRGDPGKVRMAGQMWKDQAGSLHFDNSSGTFRPSSTNVNEAADFFSNGLGLRFLIKHSKF